MGTRARIQCRRCGTHATVATLRKHHGPTGPRCIGYTGWCRMLEREERSCNKDARVLEMAGVTRREGLFYWFHRRHVEDVPNSRAKRVTWEQVECVRYTVVAPIWSIKLARRLMDDQELVKKFGRYRVEKRYQSPATRHRPSCDGEKMVIPIQMRARIIATAAASSMNRALFDDDLEAVLIMIRDGL